jgi:hypothetical protein
MALEGADASAWYPVYSHPLGVSVEPWYRVGDALVFRLVGHPDGPSSLPCFRLREGHAYATEHHEAGASILPWYDVRGSLVYPAVGHPQGVSHTPWYQQR